MTPATAHHGSTHSLDHAKVGMVCFLATEAAFFGTLVMVYIFYLDQSRPVARAVFQMPLTIVSTLCLLSSSWTIHRAVQLLESGDRTRFRRCLGVTILLGGLFLVGTGFEWADIIRTHKITIASNMFGTTYFTLVGFHAFHVSIGLVLMSVVLGCAVAGKIAAANARPVELVSWYWHFVDGVWVIVFSVVYLAGR